MLFSGRQVKWLKDIAIIRICQEPILRALFGHWFVGDGW